MQTITEIRAILEERGLHPKHRMGQNFLHDQNQLRRLLDASEVGRGDLVLEVGPGTGTLTEALLDQGCEVIASELDRDMGDIIESRLGDRLTLIRGDCLDGPRAFSSEVLGALDGRPFRLVANLPYGAASPIMSLLAAEPACLGQFVTIQREVGDRLLAKAGTRQYGPLTVFVRAFAEVRSIGTLSPNCFWPAPKVESIMIGIIPRKTPLEVSETDLGKTIHLVFSKRRKQLGTILGRSEPLPDGIDPQRRPDSLSIDEILLLAKHLSNAGRFLVDDRK
jgi:16S rRNA (adenine1518-N6/adenine1519-N6)-dimethyltransferase